MVTEKFSLKAFGCFSIVFLLLSYTYAFSQVAAFEENDLQLMPEDTAKVNRLITLGRQYCSKDNQKAVIYLNDAIVLSTLLNYEKGIVSGYLWLGRVYYYKDEYELAKTFLNKAKVLLEENRDDENLLFYHFAVASINQLTGDYITAMKNTQEVIRLSKATGDQLMLSAGLHGFGGLHILRKQPEMAIPYLKESLAVKIRIDDIAGQANVLSSIGNAYKLMGQYDSSLFYYNKSYEIRQKLGGKRRLANSLGDLGSLYIEMKRYDDAVEALEKSMVYYGKLNEKTGLCMSKLYLAMALNFKGDSVAARQLAREALASAQAMQNSSLESECYKFLSQITAYNRNFKNAYKYALLRKAIDDSLSQANKEEILQEMETKFQVQRKTDKIKLLESNNRAQRKNILILSISIAALIVILALVSILFKMKQRTYANERKMFEQEKTIRRQKEEIAVKEKQLLEEKLETQNRELASKALEMLRINEAIGNILDKMETLTADHRKQPEMALYLRNLVQELEKQTHNNTWKEFETIFKNIHNQFYQNLLSKCPELSATEIKIAALLKLNLSTKEIAAISFKSEEGIKSTRYRLRKKLGLASDESLVAFLMQL